MKPFIHYFAVISFEYFAENVQNCKINLFQSESKVVTIIKTISFDKISNYFERI